MFVNDQDRGLGREEPDSRLAERTLRDLNSSLEVDEVTTGKEIFSEGVLTQRPYAPLDSFSSGTLIARGDSQLELQRYTAFVSTESPASSTLQTNMSK